MKGVWNTPVEKGIWGEKKLAESDLAKTKTRPVIIFYQCVNIDITMSFT